jgi:[acyl-carrier-protein] S-malonyltransferase
VKYCYLFPGQGAQYPGMGKDLYEESPAVRALFDRASERSGFDCAGLIFEGSEEDLKATDNTQIAITLVNLSVSIVLKERGITPAGTAGFSLGEYAAFVEAGILSVDDVFPVVRARGRYMEEAGRLHDSGGISSGMAAVIGLAYDEVCAAVKESGRDDLYPAIWNSPVQTVVAGTGEALAEAARVMKDAGAKRVIPLKVSGPFHTPLMQQARDSFEEVLNGVRFEDPRIPVYSNVTGQRVVRGEDARRLCLDQLVSPVVWLEEEAAVHSDGYDAVLEVGPGTVLAGLWKNYPGSTDLPAIPCHAAGTLEAIGQLDASSV